MNAALRLPFAALAASSAAACYLQSDGRALEAQVAILEARQNEFSSTFDQERARLTELALRAEEEIQTLHAALEQAREFLNGNNADLGVRTDQLDVQLSELRGRLEQAEFQYQRLVEEMELLRQDFEMQLAAQPPVQR